MEELPGSKYHLSTIQAIFGIIAELWPYRLAVRTPGSHPGNPGSIPGRVTIKGFIIHSDAKQLVYLW